MDDETVRLGCVLMSGAQLEIEVPSTATPALVREKVAQELRVLAQQVHLSAAGTPLQEKVPVLQGRDAGGVDSVEVTLGAVTIFECRDRYSPPAPDYVACREVGPVPPFPCETVGCTAEALKYFGSLPFTMLSLFMSISGGVSWELVIRPLQEISATWVVIYLFYVAFTYFAVLNVVTAVFCQSAIEGAQNDHASKVHAILANKEAHLEKINTLFSKFGAEGGVITFEQFQRQLKAAEVREYFQTLGLDVWDAWSFFKLLDEDGGGEVEVEEFLMGCLRLRGQATAMDVGKIINDQTWLIKNQGKFQAYVEVELAQLKEYLALIAGSTWKMYPYKYQPHKASSPPCTFLAPHHPRLDHRVFYPFEMTSKSDLCSAYCINDHNPYCYTPEGFMQRMQQRLLEGAPEVLSLFAANPFPNKPPAQVRVVIKGVSPTSLEDHKATGNWWYVQELCEVIAPRRLDETVWDRWVPCPEAFHPEHDIWRARAATLEALRTPAPDAATVEAATAGLPEEEVASFWRDFVPEAQKSRGDWPTLWSRSQAIAARFGRKSLAVYERMVGRYVLLLRSSVTNEIIRDVGLDTLMGNWRLHLLFHDAILEGKAAYVETLKSPQSLVERAKHMDDARLLDLIGLLRPDDLRFEDLKFRYVRDLKQRPDRRGFITNVLEMDKGGFYSMLKFLLAQQPLTPLWLPKARLLDSGAWAVEGYEEQKKAPGNPLTEPMLK